jgi:glycosyltransferase involved in cell wall biosynthesis
MGKNGRKFIKENFSWEKITREFLRMFKALTLEKHD